jgi:hypothetical protein
MTQISRYALDFKWVMDYLENNLDDTNTLCSQLTNLIAFDRGKFFAFLPSNTKPHHINEFGGAKIAVGVRTYTNQYILEILKKNPQLTCVFDDYNGTFTPGYEEEVFAACGLSFKEEIYYSLTSKTVTPQLLQDCFYCSNAVFHSLCVLTKSDLSQKETKMLNMAEIKDICAQTTLIILGAYDAEGYIFWERDHCGINF